jgi:hypothetical protein
MARNVPEPSGPRGRYGDRRRATLYSHFAQELSMGILGNIVDKIFRRDRSDDDRSPGLRPAQTVPPPSASAPSSTSPSATGSASATGTARAEDAVDVGAVLESMAAVKEDRGGNYRSSIVDLLKLLDLDSSLSARRELAEELHVNSGEHGSAEQNLALHRAVMDKLAANGGIVPDSMRN